MSVEETKEEQCSNLITKLNCIVLDQERVVKQLEQISKQLYEVKRFDEAIERTIKNVIVSQTVTEERFEQLSQLMAKFETEQSKMILMQNDFRTELTNKAYMQNEIIKELSTLRQFVQSNKLHSVMIRQRLKETEREVALIGFSQNNFAESLSDFKTNSSKILDDLKLAVTSRLAVQRNATFDAKEVELKDEAKSSDTKMQSSSLNATSTSNQTPNEGNSIDNASITSNLISSQSNSTTNSIVSVAMESEALKTPPNSPTDNVTSENKLVQNNLEKVRSNLESTKSNLESLKSNLESPKSNLECPKSKLKGGEEKMKSIESKSKMESLNFRLKQKTPKTTKEKKNK